MRKRLLIPAIFGIIVIFIAIIVKFFIPQNKESKLVPYVGTFNSFKWYGEDFALIPVNNVMYVTDYSSNTCTALCSQPNCEHKTLDENPNSTCTAVAPKNYSWSSAFVYGDTLYEVFSAVNRFSIYTANKDGTSRKEVFSSEEYGIDNPATVYEDKLIAIASYINADESNGSYETEDTAYLLSYDLSDNTLEVIMDFSNYPDSYIWSVYIHDGTAYCQMTVDDEFGVYSCEKDKLNEVYLGDSMGMVSFCENGFYFPVSDATDETGKSLEIDMYSFEDKSVKKICDADGYVTVFASDDGVYYYSNSSYDGDFDKDNVRTVYYCDGENTTQCLQSTDDLTWALYCIAGDKILLTQTPNTGEWSDDETRICVSKSDFIKSGLDKAVALEKPNEE